MRFDINVPFGETPEVGVSFTAEGGVHFGDFVAAIDMSVIGPICFINPTVIERAGLHSLDDILTDVPYKQIDQRYRQFQSGFAGELLVWSTGRACQPVGAAFGVATTQEFFSGGPDVLEGVVGPACFTGHQLNIQFGSDEEVTVEFFDDVRYDLEEHRVDRFVNGIEIWSERHRHRVPKKYEAANEIVEEVDRLVAELMHVSDTGSRHNRRILSEETYELLNADVAALKSTVYAPSPDFSFVKNFKRKLKMFGEFVSEHDQALALLLGPIIAALILKIDVFLKLFQFE